MFRSYSAFDKLIDRATSELQVEPDWAAVLEVCDSIRAGDTQPKYAVAAIRKKLFSPNPHVAYFAVQVLESCVKNCGTPFHNEVLIKPFLEELREMCKLTANEKMKAKILELIQVWAHAFRNDSSHRVVQEILALMKAEGFTFPVLKESDAMFAADLAPQWVEGDSCHRCRSTFSLVVRKHHCRCCGQIFCDKCSSKSSTIPKFGIEKEVRVCDDCHAKLNPKSAKPAAEGPIVNTSPKKSSKSISKAALAAQAGPATAPAGKSDREIQEEEELQLALALSQSEAEANSQRRHSTNKPRTSSLSEVKQSHPVSERPHSSDLSIPDDPELAKYMDRDYWEQRRQTQEVKNSVDRRRSSSPAPSAPQQSIKSVQMQSEYKQEQDEETGELDAFLTTLRKSLDMFTNRMNSNKNRGRPIANDSSVQSLFLSITNQHSQLIKYLQDEDDRRLYYEGLQDKLTEIKDSRAALDALREEHQERKRKEAEEADSIRQRQMAHKLDLMRKKKQEYLDYQKQVALARIQEQERLMQLRQEQNKYSTGRHQPSAYPQPPQMNQYVQQGPAMYQPAPGMQANGHGPPQPQQQQYAPPVSQPQYHIPNGNGYHPEPVSYPVAPTGYSHPVAHPNQVPTSMPQAPIPQMHPPMARPMEEQKSEEPLISFD